MKALAELSDAHLILLAVQLCVNGDVSALPRLQTHFRGAPSTDIFFRIILSFLPESTEPSRYISVIEDLANGSSPQPVEENDDFDVASVGELSTSAARKEVQRLHLLPLRYPGNTEEESGSPLVQFLIHRAHRIDNESGLQPFIIELLQPFLDTSEYLQTWVISTALPLLRFNYEYHCENGVELSLEIIESLDSGSAVNVLLSKTDRRERGGDVGRDLRGLVGPWMYGHARSKRRKLNQLEHSGSIAIFDNRNPSSVSDRTGWQDVNEWILSTSIRDFHLAVEAVEQWAGPEDIDFGGNNKPQGLVSLDADNQLALNYGQAALAAIYATTEATPETLDGSCRILYRIASLLEIPGHSILRIFENDLEPLNLDLTALSDVSRGAILQNALLERSNPLTFPTTHTIAFTDAILVSIRTLNSFGHAMSCRGAANICLLASDEMQLSELRSVFETLQRDHKTGRDWRKIRSQLLWLRDWGYSVQPEEREAKSSPGHGLFWRVPLVLLEGDVLKAMLNARQYELAVELYAKNLSSSPLPPAQVELAVTDAIFTSYDNATNGNKTRGGIKRASEMLKSFGPYFPHSESIRQIKALISATHSLSFYSLTLQHGVPFQPVSIRAHHDPLSLIGKVLEQNPKAYTELDNLITIGRHLVTAGFPARPRDNDDPMHNKKAPSREEELLASDHRIISLSISAALESNDFDTAYSYVLTRLAPPSITSNSATAMGDDDVSWRAAYNAGRHRSSIAEPTNKTLQSQILRLTQRMELLSLALILAPSPENLPEILAVWRRCDEEMTSLRAQETAEAESWDTRGDSITSNSNLPGGFGPSDAELDALETERAKRSRTGHGKRASHFAGGYEEAPMGLFEVARGAAQAISKTAFPLRGPEAASGAGRASSDSRRISMDTMGTEDGSGGEGGGGGRVRKRDVVSSMVTGGLATGLGWVLGAQPVSNNHNDASANAHMDG
ncbi:protein transporter Sec39 [Blastomyces dermatitidis ER-3]|uniref:Protein transporter Sec39 n=1 Tax=Ajellomyces dermatitidis (strain ER-3 / ATCC MYA-2586) TaxID=559297 RepID=A0ABM9YFE4_AJEDR|nr:protein transporter Sec39 [Blastomyces dermatitidis ER-3]EEQ83778.1 protein transporter Sec39 [Blastomyces dermatitidis ER-3]